MVVQTVGSEPAVGAAACPQVVAPIVPSLMTSSGAAAVAGLAAAAGGGAGGLGPGADSEASFIYYTQSYKVRIRVQCMLGWGVATACFSARVRAHTHTHTPACDRLRRASRGGHRCRRSGPAQARSASVLLWSCDASSRESTLRLKHAGAAAAAQWGRNRPTWGERRRSVVGQGARAAACSARGPGSFSLPHPLF